MAAAQTDQLGRSFYIFILHLYVFTGSSHLSLKKMKTVQKSLLLWRFAALERPSPQHRNCSGSGYERHSLSAQSLPPVATLLPSAAQSTANTCTGVSSQRRSHKGKTGCTSSA
jgi:hypothetical protein